MSPIYTCPLCPFLGVLSHPTKAWVNESKVLIPQFYGGKKEWKEHFDYLLPFFKDNRYIKEDNKTLFIIYRAEVIDCLNDMLDYWTELARQNGFSGMKYLCRSKPNLFSVSA